MKYYFCRDLFDEELCYPLKAILDEMAEHNMDSVMVTEAVRVTGFFYCKKYNEFGITGDSDCGKSCDFYTYEEGEKKYRLYRNGVKKLINDN
ncbi:MAG: hypothetical protein PWQ06_1674 [Anaerophaga sp.]|nr:hypothetical protein [Anaerophaga sp.]